MYGCIYKTSEFIEKLIPKRRENNLINSTTHFLKFLDQFQDRNPLFTITVHAADGIWAYYQGARQFFIKPTQKHILFHVFSANRVSNAIEQENMSFGEEWLVDYADKVWKIGSEQLEWLQGFIESHYPVPKDDVKASDKKHSRHIPGDVRQAVLESFIRNGRICNGVYGKIKRHKVVDGTELEFDHILPHSKGGSSSYYNVQVLCKDCNRAKSASAR